MINIRPRGTIQSHPSLTSLVILLCRDSEEQDDTARRERNNNESPDKMRWCKLREKQKKKGNGEQNKKTTKTRVTHWLCTRGAAVTWSQCSCRINEVVEGNTQQLWSSNLSLRHHDCSGRNYRRLQLIHAKGGEAAQHEFSSLNQTVSPFKGRFKSVWWAQSSLQRTDRPC